MFYMSCGCLCVYGVIKRLQRRISSVWGWGLGMVIGGEYGFGGFFGVLILRTFFAVIQIYPPTKLLCFS